MDNNGNQIPYTTQGVDTIIFEYTPINETTKLYYSVIDYNFNNSKCPVNYYPIDSFTINSIPNVDIIADSISGYKPLTVNFNLNWNNYFPPNTLTYDWDFSNGEGFSNIKTPTHTFYELGVNNVDLIITTDKNCIAKFDTQVFVNTPPLKVFTPNAFNPKSDVYKNRKFNVIITSDTYKDFHLKIFNRWGEIMFESFNPTIGWDGTYKSSPVKFDVYGYLLTVKDLSGKEYKYTGTITILK